MLGNQYGGSKLHTLANLVGCSVGSWPIKNYLGLPLGGNPLERILGPSCIKGEEKVRLEGNLTCQDEGGYHLFNLFWRLYQFTMSLFKLLSSEAEDMEKLMGDFF